MNRASTRTSTRVLVHEYVYKYEYYYFYLELTSTRNVRVLEIQYSSIRNTNTEYECASLIIVWKPTWAAKYAKHVINLESWLIPRSKCVRH